MPPMHMQSMWDCIDNWLPRKGLLPPGMPLLLNMQYRLEVPLSYSAFLCTFLIAVCRSWTSNLKGLPHVSVGLPIRM